VRKHYPADSGEKLDVESARRVMRDVGMSEEKIAELEAELADRRAILASLNEEKQQPAMIVPHKPDKAPESPMTPEEMIPLGHGRNVSDKTIGLMFRLAKGFHEGGLYRRKFESPSTIFTVMMLGMELGITPQVACQNFHVIEGKPSPAAHFLIAMAKRHPDCEYFEYDDEASTDDSAIYVTKKKNYPREQRFKYTVQDAIDAGMTKGNWEKRRKEMLRKTAGSQAARLWYPDACAGLYSAEEMGEWVETAS
jgi:hypothetical protein